MVAPVFAWLMLPAQLHQVPFSFAASIPGLLTRLTACKCEMTRVGAKFFGHALLGEIFDKALDQTFFLNIFPGTFPMHFWSEMEGISAVVPLLGLGW